MLVAYTPNLVWHTSYTEVYSGFLQSLDADTGILGYFNLEHNCFLPHPLHCKIHWHSMVKRYIVRVTWLICLFVCLFSWRYSPLWLYFYSPVAGFSLLVFEVS
jgi:hypothetical protein